MTNDNDAITIFIVAHSAIVRAGLESVLRAIEGFAVTGAAAEMPSAPPVFAAAQAVDVILINVESEKDFEDLQAFLTDDFGDIDLPPCVALLPAELQNTDSARRILQNGVRGILPHDASADEIGAAVGAAANGLVSLSPEIIENLLSATIDDLPNLQTASEKAEFADALIENLTARETEILEMLADGASNKAIAFQLNISEHTVKFHVASIFGKLGVNTRTEAVTQALRRGLMLL